MASFHPRPRKPRLKLPRGACDTPWRDAIPFARKLVAERGSEAERRALLVDNPQRLYRFKGAGS